MPDGNRTDQTDPGDGGGGVGGLPCMAYIRPSRWTGYGISLFCPEEVHVYNFT